MFTRADVGAAVVGELVDGVAGDVLAVDDYLAFGIGIHAAQNVEHCGFAGAGCAELSYSGIPHDYALEILVSAVSSIIWLWIRRGCKEAPEQICAIIEKNKTTAPVYIIR